MPSPQILLSSDAVPLDFTIEALALDDVTVVAVRGVLDAATAPELDAALAIVGTPVIVDLCRCSCMDSSGLSVLLSHAERVRRLLVACPPCGPAHRVIATAGVCANGSGFEVGLLHVFESRETAIARDRQMHYPAKRLGCPRGRT